MSNPVTRAIKLAGGPTALAKILGVRQSVVSNWITRGRVSTDHCAAVEKAVDGQVTRKDFRPVEWKRIWPELK